MTYHSPKTLKPVRHWPVFKQQYAITTFNTLYKTHVTQFPNSKYFGLRTKGQHACEWQISDVQKTAAHFPYNSWPCKNVKEFRFRLLAKLHNIAGPQSSAKFVLRAGMNFSTQNENKLTYNYTCNSMYNFYLWILYTSCATRHNDNKW